VTDLRAVARAWRQHQAAIARSAAIRTAAAWATLDEHDLSGSWASGAGPAMVRTLAAAQRLATAGASQYVTAAVDAQGGDPAADGVVNSAAFSGSAADGRSLAGLLYVPVIRTKVAIVAGLPVREALASGANELAMLVGNEVADAGRDAAGVAMTATRSVHGYVRMVSGSACSRCIILAGKHYRWSANFQRHPRCSCTSVPDIENRAGDISTDPHAFFDHLSHAQATREGTTRRGLARQQMTAVGARGTRLSVAQIYADAAGDRDLAISLLRRFGYLS
jgi:hypothetical protein